MALKVDLSSRVAIVTGGGDGIGRATALAFAEAGAQVVVADIRAEAASQTAEEIEAKGVKALAVPVDISLGEQVTDMVARTVEAFGRIDILVNNAGITRDRLLLRMSDENWDGVLNINLRGAFLCTRAVVRYMVRQRWGRIINIASVIGLMGNVGQANYAAAKAGLLGLTKTAAREIATRGVTVNAVAPGFIQTRLTERLGEEVKQRILQQIPLGSFGLPEDVAHTVLFLASEEARYITGQVLNVDGGMVMA